MDCLFCMVGDRDLRASLQLIDAAHEMCRMHPELAFCTTSSAIREAHDAGKLAIVLSIEGQRVFDEHLDRGAHGQPHPRRRGGGQDCSTRKPTSTI